MVSAGPAIRRWMVIAACAAVALERRAHRPGQQRQARCSGRRRPGAQLYHGSTRVVTRPRDEKGNPMRVNILPAIVVLSVVLGLGGVRPATAQFYAQHNLVSDDPNAVPADLV